MRAAYSLSLCGAAVLGATLVAGCARGPRPAVDWQSVLAHSRFVRTLRCARVAHTPLEGHDWRLHYASLGWRATDEALALDLDVDGRARLTRPAAADTGQPSIVALAPAERAALARLVDGEDLLCGAEVPLVGVRPGGAYRRTVEIEVDGRRHVLSVDACYQPSDRLAWDAIVARLDLLAAPGAPPRPAAPPSAVTLDRACNDSELAATGELDRAERALAAAAAGK